MTKKKHYKSTLARVEWIKRVTNEHYEPGNQARSYYSVWRKWIYPEIKISFRTYQRYLGISPEYCSNNALPSLPYLFD